MGLKCCDSKLGQLNSSLRLWGQIPPQELALVSLAKGITAIDFEGQGIQTCLGDLTETLYVGGTCLTPLCQGVLGKCLEGRSIQLQTRASRLVREARAFHQFPDILSKPQASCKTALLPLGLQTRGGFWVTCR